VANEGRGQMAEWLKEGRVCPRAAGTGPISSHFGAAVVRRDCSALHVAAR
jgi:hypothetical protein